MSKRINKKTAPGANYSRADVEALAAVVVAAQIERERLVADRDQAMEMAALPYRVTLDGVEAELVDGLDRLEAWANAHQAEFGEKGSLVLKGGHRIGWRLGKWAAKTAKGWTWVKVVEALEAMPKAWRDAYLRVKTDANKAAMIEDRDKVEWGDVGVEFEQARRFYLEPGREKAPD